MQTSAEHDLAKQVEQIGRQARQAAAALTDATGSRRDAALLDLATRLRDATPELLAANARDLAAAETSGLEQPIIERLKLDEKRIAKMADGVLAIAGQTCPIGQTIEAFVRPDGLRIEKRRVPIGVILFFYESRPNVTTDAAALCLKSGNAIILRGGKESLHSNLALAELVSASLAEAGLPEQAVQIIRSTDRAWVPLLLRQDKNIDLVIPRGGESLIRAVVADSTIPVLKHFTGNCHIYIDATLRDPGGGAPFAGLDGVTDKRDVENDIATDDGAIRRAVDICLNAKTSYPGGAVCNAVEHILVHKAVADDILPRLCAAMTEKGVEVRGDATVCRMVPDAKRMSEDDWGTEYLSFVVGIKVVNSIDDAIAHINEFGSHHTDAIVSSSPRAINRFTTGVDSASIMINASTRLADGGEYLLGAEIGISTDKLHARGPMGATDLTTYKWIITGEGHLR